MEQTKKMPKSGFLCLHTYTGEKDFDKDYIDIEIKKVVKKVGPSDDDYVLEDKIVETKRPIFETIQSQADDSGIDAYLKPYIVTGQDLPSVSVNSEVDDFTKFPETLADFAKVGTDANKLFESLDPALKGKCKTINDFISSLSEKQIKDYLIKKLTKKSIKNNKTAMTSKENIKDESK